MPDTEHAYAKINLHLEVLNRRDDGYHNILSIMASVDLFDLLQLREARISEKPDGNVSVEIASTGTRNSVLALPVEDNIITRAVRIYCGKAGISGEFSFELEKNIPAGAGLGGGSSDGAAALKLINSVARRLKHRDLIHVGSLVGADVPFCLTGGTALCEGIGEIITPVDRGFTGTVLIANPGIHVSTGEAYRVLNRNHEVDTKIDYQDMKQRLIRACGHGSFEEIRSLFINDFEEPVMALHPEIRQIKEEIYRNGASFCIMSGSGSSIVGIFSDNDAAEKAKDNLSESCDVVIGNFAP